LAWLPNVQEGSTQKSRGQKFQREKKEERRASGHGAIRNMDWVKAALPKLCQTSPIKQVVYGTYSQVKNHKRRPCSESCIFQTPACSLKWVPADLLSRTPPVLVGRCFPNKFPGPLGYDLINLRTREVNLRRSGCRAFDFLRHNSIKPFGYHKRIGAEK